MEHLKLKLTGKSGNFSGSFIISRIFFVGTSSSLVEKFHASCLLLLFAPVIYERLRSVMDAEMEMLVPCAKSMKCLRLHIAIYNNGMHSVEIQQKHLNSLVPFTRTHTPSAQCIPRINRIPIVNGIEWTIVHNTGSHAASHHHNIQTHKTP